MPELENKFVKCPICDYKLDGATSMEDPQIKPKPGDIGICFNCGALLQYEEGYFVHELPEEYRKTLFLHDPEFYSTLLAMQRQIRNRNSVNPTNN